MMNELLKNYKSDAKIGMALYRLFGLIGGYEAEKNQAKNKYRNNPEIKRMGYMFGLSKQDDYIFTYREKKINQDDYNIIVAGETPYYKFFKIITYDIFQLFQLKYYNIKDLRYREITLLDLYDIEIKKI